MTKNKTWYDNGNKYIRYANKKAYDWFVAHGCACVKGWVNPACYACCDDYNPIAVWHVYGPLVDGLSGTAFSKLLYDNNLSDGTRYARKLRKS